MASEAALGAWVCATLLGVAAGLGVAKYAQAWAGMRLHPAVLLGVILIGTSLAVTAVATRRYLDRGPAPGRPTWPSRALASGALLLVTLFAWVALAIIGVAGWELPPARPAPGGS